MAVDYASGLSAYQHKGRCGMPELFDDKKVVTEKSRLLADMIRDSKHVVVITGAGISTAAGIPDFRGPTGVWTLEKSGKRPEVSVTFETAQPTVTHLALVALEHSGHIKYLISQNVDGLHLRSGFPRNRLAELHGDMFIEECDLCHVQYIRSLAVPTMTLQLTGGLCTQNKQRGKCRGRLRDTILDWEDTLPSSELEMSDKHCRSADLCICLGTSLQILPCGNMPLLTKKNGGHIAVVNLQTTRQDKKSDLVIHAKVDDVMSEVCRNLQISLPKWDQPCIRLKSVHTPADEIIPRVVIDTSLCMVFADGEDAKVNIGIEKSPAVCATDDVKSDKVLADSMKCDSAVTRSGSCLGDIVQTETAVLTSQVLEADVSSSILPACAQENPLKRKLVDTSS